MTSELDYSSALRTILRAIAYALEEGEISRVGASEALRLISALLGESK